MPPHFKGYNKPDPAPVPRNISNSPLFIAIEQKLKNAAVLFIFRWTLIDEELCAFWILIFIKINSIKILARGAACRYHHLYA